MRPVVLSISLLALVWAAPQEMSSNYLKTAIDKIYGNTSNTKCTTEDGQSGECVPYFSCDPNNSNTDGRGIINDRFQHTPCPSYTDVCCVATTPAPDTEQKGCGRRQSNGVGFRMMGNEVSESSFGEFPWMVAILKREPVNKNDPNGKNLYMYLGGGSLIHPSVVLTGANSVVNYKNLRVRAGEWDIRTTTELYPFQDRDVSSVVIHNDFNKGNLFYDIALLFLETPMEMAPNVGVVCLPPPSERVRGGTECLVSGWGKDKFGEEGRYSNILKKVQLPVVERPQCQNLLRTTRLGNIFELHTSFMCAGGNGADTCEGDGGSPLVCPIKFQEDRYMQSGIVAWGIGCGVKGIPGVYVDVSNLRSWIDDQMKGNGYDTKVYTIENH